MEKVVIQGKRNIHLYVCSMHINHIILASGLAFFLHALKVAHIVYHSLHRQYTSSDEKSACPRGKNFITGTSVGMGAGQLSNEYSGILNYPRNEIVGEFRQPAHAVKLPAC